MNEDPANHIAIEIDYGSRFRKQVVEEGNPDPLTGMKISIDSKYIFGSPNSERVASDYVCSNLLVQLEAVDSILNGEKEIIEVTGGPVFLVLEPIGEDAVTVTGCHTYEGAADPEKRLEVDRSGVVLKKAWVQELLDTAKQFYEEVISYNEDLRSSNSLKLLCENIEQRERTYSGYFDDDY